MTASPTWSTSCLQGEDLGTLLEREGTLPIGRVARLARQLTQGLRTAHEAGVVHRDLKPENVMIVRAPDGSEQVKVLDFGIAKVARRREAHAHRRRLGNAGLHGARAGARRQRGRPALRRLRAGRHALSRRHRPPGLHRRRRRPYAHQRHLGRAAKAQDAAPRSARRPRARHSAGDGQGSGGALRVDGRARRGADAVRRRHADLGVAGAQAGRRRPRGDDRGRPGRRDRPRVGDGPVIFDADRRRRPASRGRAPSSSAWSRSAGASSSAARSSPPR